MSKKDYDFGTPFSDGFRTAAIIAFVFCMCVLFLVVQAVQPLQKIQSAAL